MKIITDKYRKGEINQEEYEKLADDLNRLTGSNIKQPGRLDKKDNPPYMSLNIIS